MKMLTMVLVLCAVFALSGGTTALAVSQPKTSILGTKRSGVVLKCESKGWYPETEMTWLDSNGTILPAGPTETERDPEGLYTVRQDVVVQNTDNNWFICRVQLQNMNLTREAYIGVPSDQFDRYRRTTNAIVVFVLIGLGLLVAIAALLIFMKRTATKQANASI